MLKRFHDWFELGNIEYEQKIARAVHASGVRSPVVGEIIQVDNHNALIYERLPGESMQELVLRKPWKVFAYARVLAQLHAQMHGCAFDASVPAQRGRLENKINHADALPASLKAHLLSAMGQLPEGDRVCHGDLHPANVLISDADATVIDWIDAVTRQPSGRCGAYISDPDGSGGKRRDVKSLSESLCQNISHTCIRKQYFRLRPGGEDEYRYWLPIVAGARLSENIPEMETWLVKQAAQAQTISWLISFTLLRTVWITFESLFHLVDAEFPSVPEGLTGKS